MVSFSSDEDEENTPLINAANNNASPNLFSLRRVTKVKPKVYLMFGAIIFMFIVCLLIVHHLNPIKPEPWDRLTNNYWVLWNFIGNTNNQTDPKMGDCCKSKPKSILPARKLTFSPVHWKFMKLIDLLCLQYFIYKNLATKISVLKKKYNIVKFAMLKF